jgi:hypothetical protein
MVNPDTTRHEVFLLDTQTGKAWRFLPVTGPKMHVYRSPEGAYGPGATESETVTIQPGAFIPVERFEPIAKIEKPN